MKNILIIILVIAAIIGITMYATRDDKEVLAITNFNECIGAGYPMLKSYPAQCKTPDGRTFVQEIPNESPVVPVNSAEGAPEGSIHNLPVPAAVKAAKVELARKLSVGESTVVVMSAFEKEWSDGCLGLGGPAEGCIAVITPGYEVTMEAKGKTYVYRTNETGSQIREAK